MSNTIAADGRRLTRRSFLAATAAGAAAAGLASLTGCASQPSASGSLAETGDQAPIDEGT